MSDPWQLLTQRKALDDEIRAAVAEECGARGKKALLAVENGQVRKYLDFFVVTGSTGDHVIDEGICTCRDFAFRQKPCWHILAVRIAEATGKFVPVDTWYQENWKR